MKALLSFAMTWLTVAMLLCVVHYSTCFEQADHMEKHNAFQFEAFPGSILSFSIQTEDIQQQTAQVPDNIECIFACIGVLWCLSVNFQTTAQNNKLHVCELLSTDKHTHPNNMTQNNTFTHFSIKNPCEEENPCVNGGTCGFNREGYLCKCTKRFDGIYCENYANECATGTHTCPAGSTCINQVGSFTCQCPAGFSYNGVTCTDVNECSAGTHNCHIRAICTNTEGSFTCQCKTGYQGDGQTCSDVDECVNGTHNCPAGSTCLNRIGSFTCQCPAGFGYNGGKCTDVNECSAGTHNCQVRADCKNTVGSFTCQCKTGYQGDGQTCLDVDECVNGTHNCPANSTCLNKVGSFTCQCPAGFGYNGGKCTDVNECTARTHNCQIRADCKNNVGSFTCQCKTGYQGDGQTCSDVDECVNGTHNCPANSTCLNSVGSFTCQCPVGLGFNGKSCIDADSCEFELNICAWTTTNSQSNYRWIRKRGTTPSVSTGPNGDATKNLNGTGYYVFAESSSPVARNQKSELRSPVFAATSGRCLEFAYHMYGSSMGSLKVNVVDAQAGTKNGIFTKSGNKGNKWLRANANILSPKAYKVVFEVTRGSNFYSDIALDDIYLKDGNCTV